MIVPSQSHKSHHSSIMKKEAQTEKLHQALTMLAEEVQGLTDQKDKLVKALEEIFPVELYKAIRQDVVNRIGDQKNTLINHFIHNGIHETDLKKEITEDKAYLAKIIMRQSLRDCALISRKGDGNTHKAAREKLSFCKTRGNPINIDKNNEHIFAKHHSLIHLKSNSACTWIPKNACSSLRYSIALGNGAISSPDDIDWIHQNNTTLSATNNQLLGADYAFIILRNPFKRLLSFFLDKICHAHHSTWDKSTTHAQQVFPMSQDDSFEDFVELIWNKPMSIGLDHHTKPQCDFLVYGEYDDYFAFEKMSQATKTIYDKTGLEIVDSRQYNSIHTTKNLTESDDFSPETTIRDIRFMISNGRKPTAQGMYSEQMIKRIATLYLGDLLLYRSSIDNSEDELNYWIRKSISN